MSSGLNECFNCGEVNTYATYINGEFIEIKDAKCSRCGNNINKSLDSVFDELREISPSKVECKIDNSDKNANSWGVTLWNCFGKWYSSEDSLKLTIEKAIKKAKDDNFNFPSKKK